MLNKESEIMVILDYDKKKHKEIIHACVMALRQGKAVVYPTDTCYGLAVDVSNLSAVKKLYKIKGRSFKKPVSIIPPSTLALKKIVRWNKTAEKLVRKFLPGALTIILGLKGKSQVLNILSAKTGELGLRLPKHQIALDLAKTLKQSITTTSANVSGQPECYSLNDLLKQFKKVKTKPDIIINAGKLPKRKPSTLLKLGGEQDVQILRPGPVSERQVKIALRAKG